MAGLGPGIRVWGYSSIVSCPEIQSLFDTPLNRYKKQAGVNLLERQLALRLTSCDDADSVIAILQEQAEAFRKFRGHNRNFFLQKLSPARGICAGIGILLSVCFFILNHRVFVTLVAKGNEGCY
jgi:hypothetical protein